MTIHPRFSDKITRLTNPGLLSIPLILTLSMASASEAATVIAADTVLEEDLFDSVVIAADDVTLDCNGHSILGRPPGFGITLSARSGINIKDCTVSGFLVGIFATNGSSMTLTDVTVERSALDGVQAFNNTHISITGSFNVRDNGVSGLFLINDVSVEISGATVTLERNTVGLNLGLNSSIFAIAQPPLPPTTIIAQDHTSFGLTAASNSEYFLFGAVQVFVRRNGSNGISIFSKSAVELDNGASIVSEDNALNGLLLEDSTVNMFNMPQFPGPSLTVKGNAEAGVTVAKASVFDMGGDSTMLVEHNPIGLQLDDGSSATIRASTITDNEQNVVLTFGSRGDFKGNTIGSKIRCDRTVLIRGDERCRRIRKDRNHDDDD